MCLCKVQICTKCILAFFSGFYTRNVKSKCVLYCTSNRQNIRAREGNQYKHRKKKKNFMLCAAGRSENSGPCHATPQR